MEFLALKQGDFTLHLCHFSIHNQPFTCLFSLVDLDDDSYLIFRSEEVGFLLQEPSYDVKFDRQDNFESGHFYASPVSQITRFCYRELLMLGEILTQIIEQHYQTFNAKSYFANAENLRLKHFYDRLVSRSENRLNFELSNNIGPGELGYAFKTPCFRTQKNDGA